MRNMIQTKGRTCDRCLKSGGVLSYRVENPVDGKAVRVWAHRRCFVKIRKAYAEMPKTIAQGKLVARYATDKMDIRPTSILETPAESQLPVCPTCNKNDRVFASAMRGRKDFACTRCKKTFVKSRRRG